MRSDQGFELAEQAAITERRLSGLGVSPGIAIGPAHIAEGGDIQVRESHLPETELEAERGRFAEAVGVSLRQLRKLKVKTAGCPNPPPRRSATCSTRTLRCCRTHVSFA